MAHQCLMRFWVLVSCRTDSRRGSLSREPPLQRPPAVPGGPLAPRPLSRSSTSTETSGEARRALQQRLPGGPLAPQPRSRSSTSAETSGEALRALQLRLARPSSTSTETSGETLRALQQRLASPHHHWGCCSLHSQPTLSSPSFASATCGHQPLEPRWQWGIYSLRVYSLGV